MTMQEIFGDVISTYTRAQGLADGVLVDVTEWASADKGFHGGFTIPVAVTHAVWMDIGSIPPSKQGFQDVRGRAHDLLWMASLAARRENGPTILFKLIMHIGRKTYRTYKMNIGPGDNGEPVITIMRPEED